MAIEVKKRDGETTRGLIRRFSRRIQQSGVLIRARKTKFLTKPKSKREMKISAIRRQKINIEKEKLQKLGIQREDELQWIKKRIKIK